MSERTYSRRQILGLGVIGATEAVGIGAIGYGIWDKTRNYSLDWHETRLNNDAFLEENKELFQNVTIGTSFAPEMFDCGYLDGEIINQNGYDHAVDALDFTINTLGIKDIRLGMRWENVERADHSIDLSFYKPFLDKMVYSGVNVCLDIGYKTQRWPETHAPTHWEESPDFPEKGAIITRDSPFARNAILPFVKSLCEEIKNNYKDYFKNFQVENEPFMAFGEDEHTFDETFINEEIDTILKHFPDATLLLNTGAGHKGSIKRIAGKMIPELLTRRPELKNKISFGLDYYYATPGQENIPIVAGTDQILENNLFFDDVYADAQKSAQEHGFLIEVTEGQAENWHDVERAGDSVRNFRFMLLRCAERILDDDRQSLLRIWGIEKLYRKILDGEITMEHVEMVDLIQKINSKSYLPAQDPA